MNNIIHRTAQVDGLQLVDLTVVLVSVEETSNGSWSSSNAGNTERLRCFLFNVGGIDTS